MFSTVGTYEPVGLFSVTHIISIFVCLICIGVAVFLTRKMSKQTYFKVLKVFTIIVTILEIIKIGLSWRDDHINLNSWCPLFFCSLFIYSLWLTWFKNKTLKELGLSFIAYANIVAGLVFIVFPTTSFTWYPIFHFKCLYSMIFHSLMVYSGIMLYVTKSLEINIKSIIKYLIFTLTFMILALILNGIYADTGCNLMFISNPGAVPLPILHDIYAVSPALFTIVMIFAHTILMSFGMWGIYSTVVYIKNSKHKKEIIIENLNESENPEL